VSGELSSTLEDYLEAIYRIETERRVARARDICRAQGVAASTVTAALQSLAQKGLINYEPYESVTLTRKGRRRAARLHLRHCILRDFLENILGLKRSRADVAACGMEHALDSQALERLTCFVAFMRSHSPQGRACVEEFRRFAQDGAGRAVCKRWMESYAAALKGTTR